MKRVICLLLLIPLLALGQLDRMGHLSNRWHLPDDGLVAAYFMGPDGELNSTADWWDPARNALVWSQDLTGWSTSGTPVVTMTTVEDNDSGAYEYVHQTVASPDATTWTWPLWVLKDVIAPATRFPLFKIIVSANYQVRLDTSTGATTETAGLGGSHTVTSDGDYWKVVMTFTTDDANGVFVQIVPAYGANADLTTISAAAVGTITVLRQQLNLGTSSLEYEVTEARQSVYNWALTDRRNEIEYSEELDQAGDWIPARSSISADAIASPGGAVTADKLVENGDASTTHYLRQIFTGNVGWHTYSSYAKAGERTWLYQMIYAGAEYAAYFNLGTGAIGTLVGGATATITLVADGWYRVTVSANLNAAVAFTHSGLASGNNGISYSGDGSSGLYLWGQQLELGSIATTYQPKNASNYGWLDAQVGSTGGADTNDPGDAIWRKNLLADGSTEDLTVWAVTGTPVVTTFTVEDNDGAAHEVIRQDTAAANGVTYTKSIWVLKDAVAPGTRFPVFRHRVDTDYDVGLDTQSGASTESSALSGTHTVTSDGAYWKVVMTFTTDDASGIRSTIFPAYGANANLVTPSTAAVGTITIAKQQLEVGALSDYDASDRMIVGRDFDGVDDYLRVADSDALDLTAVTVLVLFRQDLLQGSYRTLISKREVGVGVNYELYLKDADNSLSFYVGGSIVATSLVPTPATWHFAAATSVDLTSATVYLDGASEVIAALGTPDGVNAGALTIGEAPSASQHFDGTIPLVAIYSRALSAAEVKRIYELLKTWWSLDQRGIRNLVLE